MGSFLPGHQQEQKPKKQRIEPISPISPPIISTVTGEETRGLYGVKPFVTSAAFNADNNSSSLTPPPGFRNSAPENNNNSSLPVEELNCEVSC